jgi:flavin-dependent dehydrogenase
MKNDFDIIIAGGGLAGLTSAILLSEAGLHVLLVEKKKYPFHRVCGEYISREVLPFLKTIGVNPFDIGASHISKFFLSSPSGRQKIEIPLDLGGFGISRYVLDELLYKKALTSGVTVLQGVQVQHIEFQEDSFVVRLADEQFFTSKLVIGAFGKRSNLDKQLYRRFISQRSPYIGVKYHLKTDFPKDLIALHNFEDGYCGISAVEDDRYNFCYLTTRNNLKKYGTVEVMEEEVLFKNPFLRYIKNNSEWLFEKPEVINEISFAPKKAVENHVLMCGDTAGLITPLCGNGMALALHGAKILSENIIDFYRNNHSRDFLEKSYAENWQKNFARRLWVGRNLQNLFGNIWLSEIAIGTLKHSKPIVGKLVALTHGNPF